MLARTDGVLGMKNSVGGDIVGLKIAPFHQIFAQAFEGGYLLGAGWAYLKVSNQADANARLVG